MFRIQALLKRTIPALLVGICLQAALAPVAVAQDNSIYPQLQVLVPGQEPAPATANGVTGSPLPQTVGIPFQVRVRACDTNWETHPGIINTIHISCTDASAELPPETPLTDGEMTTWVTLNAQGEFSITAMDQTDGQPMTVTSAPVPAVQPQTGTELAISTIEDQQIAGQAIIITISARRADGSLDPTKNGPVDLFELTSLGQGVLSPETIQLNGGQWTGNVTFFLADPLETERGEVRLKATMKDEDVQGLSNRFHVGAGAYSRLLITTPGQSWTPWIVGGINGEPQRQWADGPFIVHVYGTDEYWNRAVVYDEVKLESGDPEANTPISDFLSLGHTTFEVSMRTPGSWFLAVSDVDQPEIGGMVSGEIPLYYSHLQILLPGETAAPGTSSGKTGQPLAQVAGIPFPVTIRACNANFEPVPTDQVVVRLGTTDYSATLPAAQPLNNGTLVTNLTFNSSGTFTVNAEDISGPEYYTVVSPEVAVSGSTGIVSSLAMATIGTFQVAGQPVLTTIRAIDSDGDQVHTFGGAVQLQQLTSLGTGSLEPSQIEMSGGTWTGPVTYHLADQSTPPGQDGGVQLRAASLQDQNLDGTSNFFQVAPGALSRLLIQLPGQILMPATEDGLTGGVATQAAGFPFFTEIYAADQFWNRVPINHSISIESMDPNASTPVQADLENGHATVPVSFGSVGNWTLTVSDLTAPSVSPMTTVPISVISNSPTFFIDPVASPVTAGEPVQVTISSRGPDDELLEAYNGFATLVAETGPQTIEPTNIQFTGGVWTGEVTFFGASPQTSFSCVDFASPPNIGTSGPFQVNHGAFAGLQVLLPGQDNHGGRDPGHTGRPDGQEAGIPFNVTILAVDSWWNPVGNVDPQVTCDLTDPFALAPSDTNLTGGRLDLETTFLRAGTHTFTTTTSTPDIAAYISSNFTVRPGPYARIIALAPGEELLSGSELGKTGLALDQSISYSFVMGALATDNWWNPVEGVFDQIELICTDSLAEIPATFSLENSEAQVEVRLATAGYQLMTLNNLSNSEIPPAHTQMRAIESGFHIEAEIHPEQVVAGQPFTLSVRVTNDAGAVMQDINGMAEVAVLNATSQEPGQGELLNASFQFHQGVRSITQTYTRSEPIVLMVTSPLGEAPGLTNVLMVVPGEPASLEFFETAGWVGGRHTIDINAKVADELDNGIPDMPVDFQLTAGTGTLEIINDITDAEGLAKARYTGADSPESGFIQVASAGFITAMEIMTSLLDPGSSGGTISNYPNPFHPGDGGTTITYMLSNEASVNMRLFTLSGTLVFKRDYPAGQMGGLEGINEVGWDGRNGQGDYVASGGYILYVEAERQGETIHKIHRRIAVVR